MKTVTNLNLCLPKEIFLVLVKNLKRDINTSDGTLYKQLRESFNQTDRILSFWNQSERSKIVQTYFFLNNFTLIIQRTSFSPVEINQRGSKF